MNQNKTTIIVSNIGSLKKYDIITVNYIGHIIKDITGNVITIVIYKWYHKLWRFIRNVLFIPLKDKHLK